MRIFVGLGLISIGCLLSTTTDGAERAAPSGESDLVISEIHYHPPGDAEQHEFVEVTNRGSDWVDVGRVRIVGGIRFEFPEGIHIGPAEAVVIARSPETMRSRSGRAVVLGPFEGRLSNAGEILELRSASGRRLTSVHYRDGAGATGGDWPRRPDGDGPSLELDDPDGVPEHASSWSASFALGGSPGRAEFRRRARTIRPPRPAVRLHEFRGGAEGFVELLSTGTREVDLTGWRLQFWGETDVVDWPLSESVGRGRLRTVAFEGQAFEGQALDGPALEGRAPDLDARHVFLVASDGRLVDSLPASPSTNGSTGRGSTGRGRVLRFATPSRGRRNSDIETPDVVIHEFLYHDAKDAEFEFVELANTGRSAVDVSGWRLAGGIEFQFPNEAMIEPKGYVIIARRPEQLPARAGGTKVFGPWKGRLGNAGDSIELEDALGNRVDRVRYDDRDPWPRSADGGGYSVELIHPGFDNDTGAAWALGPQFGTPGKPNRRAQRSAPATLVRAKHSPAVVEPGGTATVEATLASPAVLRSAFVVYYEISSDGQRSKAVRKRLGDRGRSGDRVAGDGVYSASIRVPSRATTLGYRIELKSRGRSRFFPTGRWPGSRSSTSKGPVVAEGDESYEFLMPVESTRASRPPGLPRYRILLSPEMWAAMEKEKPRANSKEWHACSLVFSPAEPADPGRVFHGARVRFRGNNSRNNLRRIEGRMSYCVALAPGDTLNGRRRLIFNADNSYRQLAGGRVMRQAGLPAPIVRAIRLSAPGAYAKGFDDSRYVELEDVDGRFLEETFGDASGMLYRGRRGSGKVSADFVYHGPDPEQYREAYEQQNHSARADISRLVELLSALDTKDPDAFEEKVEAIVDVDNWVTYFAANKTLGNTEGGLSFDAGDDYYLYERGSDGRFVLIPWDQDSTFADRSMDIYDGRMPRVVRRFLDHPKFARLYQRRVREFLDGPLEPRSFHRLLRSMRGVYRDEEIRELEEFVAERQRFLRGRRVGTHRTIAIVEGGPVEGGGGSGARCHVTPGASHWRVRGKASPWMASTVRVNALSVAVHPRSGAFDLPIGAPPPKGNAWVEWLDGDRVVSSLLIALVQTARFEPLPRTVQGSGEVTAEPGTVFVLDGVTTVAPGARWRFGPGVDVVCRPGSQIVVRGRLEIDGERTAPVRFAPTDPDEGWRGIHFVSPGTSSLRSCWLEGGIVAAGKNAAGAAAGFVSVDRGEVSIEDTVVRSVQGRAVAVGDAALTARGLSILDADRGLSVRRGKLELAASRIERIFRTGIHAEGARAVEIEATTCRDVVDVAIDLEGGSATIRGGAVSRAGVGVAVSGGELSVDGTAFAANGVHVAVKDSSGTARSSAKLQGAVLGPGERAFEVGSSARLSVQGGIYDPRLAAPEEISIRGALRKRPTFIDPSRGDFRLAGGSE